jgi:hypothetical protein
VGDGREAAEDDAADGGVVEVGEPEDEIASGNVLQRTITWSELTSRV